MTRTCHDEWTYSATWMSRRIVDKNTWRQRHVCNGFPGGIGIIICQYTNQPIHENTWPWLTTLDVHYRCIVGWLIDVESLCLSWLVAGPPAASWGESSKNWESSSVSFLGVLSDTWNETNESHSCLVDGYIGYNMTIFMDMPWIYVLTKMIGVMWSMQVFELFLANMMDITIPIWCGMKRY